MSTEQSNEPESLGADTSATVSAPVWYKRLNEDWIATIVGLLLVLLIVVRLLHAIP